MTAAARAASRSTPARFDASSQQRRSLIAKVHVAKKQLALADDDYRAVMLRVVGKRSASECSETELVALVKEFERLGFSAKARPNGPRSADHPIARKARALWISLHQLGAIDNPSDQALEAFARRQLKVAKLQWANQRQADGLIEALKSIATRHGWDQELAGIRPEGALLALKRRLVIAQLAKLKAADLIPASWDERRAVFELAGVEIESIVVTSLSELDAMARAFGAALREGPR